MTSENICQFCGAPLDNNAGSQCPSCGSALPSNASSSSAATFVIQKPVFNNSAEAMDEVKKLIREGDTEQASEVAQSAFGQTPESAQTMISQTAIDMSHSGRETPPPAESEPERAYVPAQEDVIDTPPASEPPQPPKKRNWILIGSVGAVVFMCLCCCLPLIAIIVYLMQNN